MKKIIAAAMAALLMICLAACGQQITLAEIVEESQKMIPDREQQLGGAIMISITSEDDVLIYRYTFREDVGDKAEAAAAIEQGMTDEAASYEEIVEGLRAQGLENTVLRVQYCDMNGDVIYETEFE